MEECREETNLHKSQRAYYFNNIWGDGLILRVRIGHILGTDNPTEEHRSGIICQSHLARDRPGIRT